jgi:hypothetical protein
MSKALIKTLLKKGSSHKLCEDSFFYRIYNEKIFIATFDGCSSGKESHFASNLFKKIFNKSIISSINNDCINCLTNENLLKVIFHEFYIILKDIQQTLGLSNDEILSTIVFSMIDLKSNETYFLVSGDGMYSFNKILQKIDQNNTPDYISYHLQEDFEKVWKTFTIKFFNDKIFDISVSSDGLDSYNEIENIDISPIDSYLFQENFIKSEVMLSRVYNILENKGFSHYDDLSIVRVIISTD